MKTLLLQYPDGTPMANIVDHMTQLARGIGNKGQRATVSFEDGELPGLRSKLRQRGVPLGTQAFAALDANQAVVTDGEDIDITGGTVALDVADNEITGGAFTETP